VTDSTRSGYQLEPAWQAGVGNGAGVGAFFGAIFNGWLVNHFGQKYTIIGALIALTGFIFMTFFAQNIETLLAGQILCGLPWGVFATSVRFQEQVRALKPC
jgi:MFS transporter, SP family, general alpha glucoside:H+ symporter